MKDLRTRKKKSSKKLDRFASILDVMQDEQFEKYLNDAVEKALNPPPAPKGLRYKEEPWERLKRFKIDTPAAILREHGLIMANRSMEKAEMKNFITSIVQGAVTATIMHYKKSSIFKRIGLYLKYFFKRFKI